MTKLPTRTNSQRIGISAAKLLNAVLTQFCNVTTVEQESDFGIDFICELMQGEHPTGKLFYVQCKGIEGTEFRRNKISVPIKVTTINYWFNHEKYPTFLFVVDYRNQIFYWSFPEEFIDSINYNWREQETVSIPVSTQDSFLQDVRALPARLLSIIDTQSSGFPHNRNSLGRLTLMNSMQRAEIEYELSVLSSPFYRPFQYIGMSILDAVKAVGIQPNEVNNIAIDSEQAHMLLEAEGNFINYVYIEIKKTAPWNQKRPFDSEAILAILSINPGELELAREQIHYHTYYDHKRKLKIGVSCQYDSAPLSVDFSSKYYGM